MSDYSITLPTKTAIHKPNLNGELARITYGDMEIALSAFDTDEKKGLSSEELLQAFDYFVYKEKEIAVTGKKGDSYVGCNYLHLFMFTPFMLKSCYENIAF